MLCCDAQWVVAARRYCVSSGSGSGSARGSASKNVTGELPVQSQRRKELFVARHSRWFPYEETVSVAAAASAIAVAAVALAKMIPVSCPCKVNWGKNTLLRGTVQWVVAVAAVAAVAPVEVISVSRSYNDPKPEFIISFNCLRCPSDLLARK